MSTMVAFIVLLSGGATAQQAWTDQEEVPRAAPRIAVVVRPLKPLDAPSHTAPPIPAIKPLDPNTEKLFREFVVWRKAHF
jgi:hypothetical protein